MVGQNAYFFKKNTNSVIILNHILFPDLNVKFMDNLVFFKRKVYPELHRTTS